MMQDWADRLDLLEQGQVEAASAHLTIHIEGVPAMAEEDKPNTIVAAASVVAIAVVSIVREHLATLGRNSVDTDTSDTGD